MDCRRWLALVGLVASLTLATSLAGATPVAVDEGDATFEAVYADYEQGHYIEALTRAGRGAAEHPSHGDLARVHADLLAFLFHLDQAEAEYYRALKLDPGSVDALVGLASLLIATQREVEGAPLLESARSRAPDRQDVAEELDRARIRKRIRGGERRSLVAGSAEALVGEAVAMFEARRFDQLAEQVLTPGLVESMRSDAGVEGTLEAFAKGARDGVERIGAARVVGYEIGDAQTHEQVVFVPLFLLVDSTPSQLHIDGMREKLRDPQLAQLVEPSVRALWDALPEPEGIAFLNRHVGRPQSMLVATYVQMLEGPDGWRIEDVRVQSVEQPAMTLSQMIARSPAIAAAGRAADARAGIEEPSALRDWERLGYIFGAILVAAFVVWRARRGGMMPSDQHKPEAPTWLRQMALASALIMPFELILGPQLGKMIASGRQYALFITLLNATAALTAVVLAIIARRAGRPYGRDGVWLRARIGLLSGSLMLALLSSRYLWSLLRQ